MAIFPRRILRHPRNALVAIAAIGAFGVLSSSVGIGALPTTSLPVFGVTTGEGSRTTVAELGDVNGDGIGDYAVGKPYADANGTDSGIVYVFLGPGVSAPASLDVGAASFTITGHGGELLGFSVTGGDFNGDGRADIGIGAPMAAGPNRAGAGVVYTVFGSRTPRNVSTTELNYTGFTNDPVNPAPHSPIGSRYEGFQPNSHTGTAVAAMPDVNGDGYDELAIGMPDASLHRPGGGGAAVLYGKPSGEHINLADLWEAGYPYYFHIDYPTLDNQHIGETLASVPDMTGDGSPDLAIGAPQSDLNGKVDSGSVWIINGRLPPATGCRRPTVDATCPWIRIDRLSAAQGYRIDGAAAGDGLGSSLANVGDVNGDGRPDLAIGASSASPYGRSGAGEVVVMAGQADPRRPPRPLRCSASPGLLREPGWARHSRARAMSTATAARICSPVRRARPPMRALRTSCAALRARLPISHRVPSSRASLRRERAPRRAAPWPPARAERSSPHPGRTTATAARSASPAAAGPLRHPLRRPLPPRRLAGTRGQGPGCEEAQAEEALPAQEAEAEAPDRQGQARESEARACRPRHKAKAKTAGTARGGKARVVARSSPTAA